MNVPGHFRKLQLRSPNFVPIFYGESGPVYSDICGIFDHTLIFVDHYRSWTHLGPCITLSRGPCADYTLLHPRTRVSAALSSFPPQMGRSNRDIFSPQCNTLAYHATSQCTSDSSDLESPVFGSPDGDGNNSRCKFVFVTIAARILFPPPDSI